MKNKQLLKTWLVTGFSALSILYSCTNEDYSAGITLHPPSELISVHHDSSLVLQAYSYKMENYMSVGYNQTSLLFGYCNDPVLGESRNEIATHIGYSTSFKHPTTIINDSTYNDLTKQWDQYSIVYQDSIAIDSVSLIIEFESSTGIPLTDSISTEQKFEIYELSHDVNLANLYGQELDDSKLDGYFKSEKLTDTTYTPYRVWPNDERKTLKINLPLELGKRLLQDTLFINSDTILPYNDEEDFNKYILNGLYFKPNTENKERTSISTVQMQSTRIDVKYRTFNMSKEEPSAKDTTAFSVSAGLAGVYSAGFFNKTFDESKIVINDMYAEVFLSNPDSLVYIKDNNGLYARIVIDDIGDWDLINKNDSSVSINKASVLLECSESYDTNTIFAPINTLSVLREIGRDQNPIFYSSPYIKTILQNKTGYEINFTNEMQEMIKNKERSITFVIKSQSNYSGAQRSIFYSPTHPNPAKRMKVLITYTKY